jgi:hypothetical protein
LEALFFVVIEVVVTVGEVDEEDNDGVDEGVWKLVTLLACDEVAVVDEGAGSKGPSPVVELPLGNFLDAGGSERVICRVALDGEVEEEEGES